MGPRTRDQVLDDAAAAVEVADDVAHILLRSDDLAEWRLVSHESQ